MIKLKDILNEATLSSRSISKWNKLAGSSSGRKKLPMLLIKGRWYAWEEGDKNSVFVSDKSGNEREFKYSDVDQIKESINEKVPELPRINMGFGEAQDYSKMMIKKSEVVFKSTRAGNLGKAQKAVKDMEEIVKHIKRVLGMQR